MENAQMDTEENPSYLSSLPTELITTIFCYLPAKDLMKCSKVCSRWKAIVNKLSFDEYLWRDHSKREYCDIYNAARYKAKLNLHSFQLYRSLSVWPQLAMAREIRGEFSVATKVNEQIRSFRILGDGTIGVHKRGSIVYYYSETFDLVKDREPIFGDYSTYNENNNFIALLDYFQHLYLVRKSIDNPKMEPQSTFDSVVKFVLVNKLVYYITLADEIYTTNADVENLESKFIIRLRQKVLSLGYKERLHILTEHHDIYTLVDNKLVHVTTISHDPSPLHQLQKHNIYDPFCWQTYFQTTRTVRLRDIVTVFKYGDVFFLGTCWGILHIYYAPLSSERLDLENTEPMKRYNFFEKDDVLLSSRCPILQVDVIETDYGHTVLVCMPRKMISLKFVHNFIEPTYYSVSEDGEEDVTLGYSCVDLLNAGMRESGVYYLQIRGTTYWFLKVYCEQNIADGGWTVIHRRDDFGVPAENFNRDWSDYKNGFGDPSKEFWLGNENIYMLTNNDDYMLRVELEDFDGNKRYAQYSHFKIYSEAEYYKLEIDGYEGSAGDSLNDPWYGSNNSPFSTYNRDNDRSSLNCASMLKGGWWWKSCGRGLNGLYLHDPQDLTARQGIVWFRWRGWDYTLKRASMMIKPKGLQPNT